MNAQLDLTTVTPIPTDTDIPDWSRERPAHFFDRGAKLIKSIRAYQNATNIISKKIAVARWMFWSVVSGAEIPLNTQIGGGFKLIHTQGIVVHPNTVIGNNVMIMQNVTLGTNGPKSNPPTLDHGVFIGANAVVVGDVFVPQNTRIQALSLVRKSLTGEHNKLWAGNPAKVITT